jgi:hypothetical protein
MSFAPHTTNVISTEGGAFAAAVERSLYFAFAVAFAVVFVVAVAVQLLLGNPRL